MPHHLVRRSILLAILLGISGCSLMGGNPKTAQQVDKYAVSYKLPLNVFAGSNLNSSISKQPLGVVVKIYQLSDYHRFEQTALPSFLDKEKAQTAFGDDLLTSREITVLPGKTYRLAADIRNGTRYLGIVALFMAPAKGRWRAVFDTKKSRKQGITIGLSACALTVTSGKLVTEIPGDPGSLSTVDCPEQM